MIAMPNADSHTARTMQEDNTELAYEASLQTEQVLYPYALLTFTRACLRSSLASS